MIQPNFMIDNSTPSEMEETILWTKDWCEACDYKIPPNTEVTVIGQDNEDVLVVKVYDVDRDILWEDSGGYYEDDDDICYIDDWEDYILSEEQYVYKFDLTDKDPFEKVRSPISYTQEGNFMVPFKPLKNSIPNGQRKIHKITSKPLQSYKYKIFNFTPKKKLKLPNLSKLFKNWTRRFRDKVSSFLLAHKRIRKQKQLMKQLKERVKNNPINFNGYNWTTTDTFTDSSGNLMHTVTYG